MANKLGHKTIEGENQVELLKGPLWYLVKLNSNIYNFARMIVRLDKEAVRKNDIMYVPVEFFTEVLKINVRIRDG